MSLTLSGSIVCPWLGYAARAIPELPEVGSALIGWILVPQQLAAELVIQSNHEGLDEASIGTQKRNRVRRHQLQPGQQPVLSQLDQRL